ncbi:Clp protease N-terminal domain-containing protein [Micromonospora zhanjiangensis]|uniref:Clp protease N-terminal domain-containing protein n=1 Tax=Micromonospora zhanjiangensis TaxID=1522057 RepID=A0ABV8KG51_9ACTN
MVNQPLGRVGAVRLGHVAHQALSYAYSAVALSPDRQIGTHHLWQALRGLEGFEKFRWPERYARERIHFRGDPATGDDSRLPTILVPGLEFEIDAALREARWRVIRTHHQPLRLLLGSSRAGRELGRPDWAPGVRAALAATLLRAYTAAVPVANALHLMLGLVDDPSNRAVAQLGRQGIDLVRLRDQLDADPNLNRSGAEREPVVFESALDDGRSSSIDRRKRWRREAGRWLLRVSRQGPLYEPIVAEQRRQAVRLDDPTVTVQHTVLAVLWVDEQLRAMGRHLLPEYQAANAGARILVELGVRAVAVLADATVIRPVELADPAILVEALESARPGDPLLSAATAKAFARADEIALERRHPGSGTTHLLYALVEQPDAEAGELLRRVSVDPVAVRDRAERQLAELSAVWSG